MTTRIPIYKPYLTKRSVSYAKDAIDSGWISSIGEYLERATEELKSLTNSKYAVLVNNGTAATHLCVRALKRKYPDTKRVFVPSACYVAAYNCLMYDNNNWILESSDINIDTWNMAIPKHNPDDAIMAVHNLGNIIDLQNVSCPIIEDSCESFFANVKNPKSLCSSLSFFGNKNVTSGEGGAVLTDDEETFVFIKKIMGQGQTAQRYVHDELGYNYRMTNIQAAILLGQLENYEHIHNKKRDVFRIYNNILKNIDGIRTQKIEIDHSFWIYGVRLLGSKSYQKNKEFLNSAGIDVRPMFYPSTTHKHVNVAGEHKNINLIHDEIVLLPSYPELTVKQIEYICSKIKELINENSSNS